MIEEGKLILSSLGRVPPLTAQGTQICLSVGCDQSQLSALTHHPRRLEKMLARTKSVLEKILLHDDVKRRVGQRGILQGAARDRESEPSPCVVGRERRRVDPLYAATGVA